MITLIVNAAMTTRWKNSKPFRFGGDGGDFDGNRCPLENTHIKGKENTIQMS